MGADFNRIRREMNKLRPSFPAALDRAFDLMKQHELPECGDSHHGLMKSIWTQHNFQKRAAEWNRVRIPRQIHIEVHVLYAAAFIGSQHFPEFNSARVLAHAPIRKGFTVEEIQQMKNLYEKYFYPLERLAKQHRISRKTLIPILKQAGVVIRRVGWQVRFTNRQIEQIKHFYTRDRNPLGTHRLGEKFNVAPSTIRGVLTDAGIPIRSIGQAQKIYYNRRQREEFKALYEKNFSERDLARHFNISTSVVRRAKREFGISTRRVSCRRRTQEQYDQQLLDKNTSVKRLEKYVGSAVKIIHLCICGNRWSVTPNNVLSGYRCGLGKRSSRLYRAAHQLAA
jgi:hypothetical protein